MSAGAFTISKYAASYGGGTAIHPIRVQAETIAATIAGTANAAPAGNTTNPISAVVSRSNTRSRGLNARMVSLKSPTSSPPEGYKADSVTRIPALQQAFYDAATNGVTCTYNGAAFTVVGRSAESAR